MFLSEKRFKILKVKNVNKTDTNNELNRWSKHSIYYTSIFTRRLGRRKHARKNNKKNRKETRGQCLRAKYRFIHSS